MKYLPQGTSLASKSPPSPNRSSLPSPRISSRHPIRRAISLSTRVSLWEGIVCPLSMSRGRKTMIRRPRSWMTWRSSSESKASSWVLVLKAPVLEGVAVVGETSNSPRVSYPVLSMSRNATMSRRSSAWRRISKLLKWKNRRSSRSWVNRARSYSSSAQMGHRIVVLGIGASKTRWIANLWNRWINYWWSLLMLPSILSLKGEINSSQGS